MNTNTASARVAIESCWNTSYSRSMATNGHVVYWIVTLMVLTKSRRYMKMEMRLEGASRLALIDQVAGMVKDINTKRSITPRLWTANGRDTSPVTTAQQAEAEALA